MVDANQSSAVPVAQLAAPAALTQPPKLVPNVTENGGCSRDRWTTWKKRWESFAIVANLKSQPQEYQVACLTMCLTEETLETVENLPYKDPAERKDVNKILGYLENHLVGKVNEIYESYRFFSRQQEEFESISAYVTAVHALASTCNFGDLRERLIRDRIVCGIRNKALQRSLLSESNLTLESCVQKCKTSEAAGQQVQGMSGTSQGAAQDIDRSVNMVTSRRPSRERWITGHAQRECKFCGRIHGKRSCPAYGKTCDICQGRNHFASVCRTRTRQRADIRGTGAVHQLEAQNTASTDEDGYWIMTITEEEESAESIHSMKPTMGKRFPNKVIAELEMDERKVKFQIDTGASCNVINLANVSPRITLEPTNKVLSLYDQSKVRPLGVCQSRIRNNVTGISCEAEFVVIESSKATPILGAETSQTLDLVRIQYQDIAAMTTHVTSPRLGDRAQVLKMYGDVFSGELGTFSGQAHLHVLESATPTKTPLRRIPVAMKQPLQDELKRLEELGIIVQEHQPTDWLSAIVTVQKANGKLRVCIDPKPLNKVLKRAHYPFPVLEDILPRLSKARVFSIVDVASGFWHVELDESSSLLTTFSTPFGNFRWKRLPFGIATAPELFQMRLDAAINKLKGIAPIVDDILIWGEGETDEEAAHDHDRNLQALLERCRQENIKLNAEKLQFRVEEVTYVGHRLSKKGLSSDPAKVSAINDMPTPTDKQSLQRFLGMVNYLVKFLPELSDTCKPLRDLLQNGNMWHWGVDQEKAFKNIKRAIVNTPVLKFFDPTLSTTVQCDASSTGLGAVLFQQEQPIAYASRALTTTEQGYSQIEKELLSVVFAMERFDQYVYGRDVEVRNDHQPLQTISGKPLHFAPKRLQRMLLRLQRYSYSITYQPGKEMHVSDALLRACPGIRSDSSASANDVVVAAVQTGFEKHLEKLDATVDITLPPSRLARLKHETAQDKTLQALAEVIKVGWPADKRDIALDVRAYHNVRDELTVENGIIFRGQRCVVPSSLRREVVEKLHTAHMGIDACLRRARECVYWPGLNGQIKDHVQACQTCQMYAQKQPRETFLSTEVPTRPWSVVAADLFSFAGREYMVLVDYYSNFIEVDVLPDTLSTTIIYLLKRQFARHGIPDKLRTDNGPQFSSAAFQKFAYDWHFQHSTSSPHYSQSNGLAESAVKTIKNIMRKAKESGGDAWMGLLAHRNTPSQDINKSPAQLLFGRRARTTLPSTEELLRPAGDSTTIVDQLAKRKLRQAESYNHSATDLEEFQLQQEVWIMPERKGVPWTKATVLKDCGHRSYVVQTEEGQQLRRNRRHLRPVYNSSTSCQGEEEEVFVDQGREEEDKQDTEDENEQEEESEESQADSASTQDTRYVTRYGRRAQPRRDKDFIYYT